jgi:hypothetical protein
MNAEKNDKPGIVSWLVFWLSLCLVTAAVLETCIWCTVAFFQPDTWGAFCFRVFTSFVGSGALFFVVIPSAILYQRKRKRLDLVSLCIAIVCLLALCAEFVVFFLIPLKPGSPAS